MGTIRGVAPGIGARLRAALKEKRMTQDALAAKLGVDRVMVNHWVNERYPPTDHIVGIVDALGLSLDYFIRGKRRATQHVGEQAPPLTAEELDTCTLALHKLAVCLPASSADAQEYVALARKVDRLAAARRRAESQESASQDEGVA